MNSLRRKIVDNITRIADIAVMLATFIFAMYAFPTQHVPATFWDFLTYKLSLMNLLIGIIMAVAWMFIFEKFGLYQPRRLHSLLRELSQVVQAVIIGVLVIASVVMLPNKNAVSTNTILLFGILALVFTMIVRTIIREFLVILRNSGRNLRYVLFVGNNPRAIELAQKILSKPELGYRLIGFVDNPKQWNDAQPRTTIVCTLDELPNYLDKNIVDEVYMALPIDKNHELIRSIIALCQEMGIVCRVPSDWLGISTTSTSAFQLDDEAILTVFTGSPHQLHYLWLKRVLDVLLALCGILFFLPIGIFISFLIRITSPGPVFFRQKRIGYNRRKFEMYKFRTMVQDAEKLQSKVMHMNEMDGPVFKIQQDPRITPVGKWLRKTSLDELPQLINVLKGDMSLVGPRPLPLRDVQGFEKRAHKRRFSMRPGLTCLWQVGERNNINFEDWMKLDLEYIDKWSIGLDFKILAKTIPAIVKGTGQ